MQAIPQEGRGRGGEGKSFLAEVRTIFIACSWLREIVCLVLLEHCCTYHTSAPHKNVSLRHARVHLCCSTAQREEAAGARLAEEEEMAQRIEERVRQRVEEQLKTPEVQQQIELRLREERTALEQKVPQM